jgi:hypothetical protein
MIRLTNASSEAVGVRYNYPWLYNIYPLANILRYLQVGLDHTVFSTSSETNKHITRVSICLISLLYYAILNKSRIQSVPCTFQLPARPRP